VIHSAGGTSTSQWVGSSVDAAGKSGTAEDIGFGANHVFFVAYANRGDPSIIALAALETGESGSRRRPRWCAASWRHTSAARWSARNLRRPRCHPERRPVEQGSP
jgi:cell division protein FtsI/penicillin-binding protein 2